MIRGKKKSGGINTDRLKLEMRRAAIPFIMLVVLFVVGFANASNIIRNLAGQKFWKDYTEYRVAFANPEGVVPQRHELRIAGVKSGFIKETKLLGGKRAVLTLAVDKKDAPLYNDATVEIRPVTPLEDMYIDITSRGTEKAGELTSGEKGRILPQRQTNSMVEVGRILNVLDPEARPRLKSILTQFSKGLGDDGDQLKRAFAELGPFLVNAKEMSEVLNKRRKQVRSLVGNLAETTEVLGDSDRQLTSLIRNGRDSVEMLANNDAPLAATLRNLPPTVNSMRSAFASLQATEDRLDAAFRAMRPTAKTLPSGLRSLRQFARDADPAVVALRPAVKALRPLARQLRPTMNTLTRTLSLVRDQAPVIDKATDKLAQPRCRRYVSDLLTGVASMMKFNVGGLRGSAHARADVNVGFTTPGGLFKNPGWFIEPPCYLNDSTPTKGGELAPLRGPNREATR